MNLLCLFALFFPPPLKRKRADVAADIDFKIKQFSIGNSNEVGNTSSLKLTLFIKNAV
jgi:hypothetical protein